ncbi:MAG: histidine kinase dimerization/phospho-acceptor domain-containing protein [Peptostreptococcaceae bacterium]
MKNNIIKKIFLIISLISFSIVLAVIPIVGSVYSSNLGMWTSYIHEDKKILETDFYKSNVFEYRVLRPVSYWIGETVTNVENSIEYYIDSNTHTQWEEYTDSDGNVQSEEKTIVPTREEAIESLNSSIEDAKKELENSYPDIQYFVINNNDKIVYSNTLYKTLEDYKKNVNGYVDIEIYKKAQGGVYTKDINGKVYKNSSNANYEVLDAINNDNIEIYMSFPKEINTSSILYNDLNQYITSVKYVNSFVTLGSISFIVFLLFTILYKLIKGHAINKEGIFIKMIKKIPLEIWLGTIFIGGIFTVSFLISHYYGYSYNIEKAFGFLGSFIIVTMLYLQLYIFSNYDNKIDFFKNTIIYKGYKIIKNSMVSILRASKKMPIVKQIILISILITGSSFFIAFILRLFGLRTVSLILPVFLSMGAFTWYIVKNLSYLGEIMDGAQKIKNGDLHYKIDIDGYNSFTGLAENINNIGEGLEKSIDKQLRSERLRSELITNVSHDLKTPLTSIINYIELIKKEENIQPQVINDYVNVLDNKSKRLKSLIEDLFEASKASSGNIDLNMQNIEIRQLLNQSIGELEEKLNCSNLELKVNVPNEKIYIYADGRRMFRVFENLLSNIAKYSLPNTRVYIDIIEENENIKLTMKNISAYELNFDASEITERFKRGDESRNTEGSGLGLAISKDLVKLQNGKFDIDIDGDLFKVALEFKKAVKEN